MAEGLHLVERTRAGAELKPMGRTQVVENFLQWEASQGGAGENCEEYSTSGGESSGNIMMNRLQPPFPILLLFMERRG